MSLIDIDAELWAFSQDAAIVVANAHEKLDAAIDKVRYSYLLGCTHSIFWTINRDAAVWNIMNTLMPPNEVYSGSPGLRHLRNYHTAMQAFERRALERYVFAPLIRKTKDIARRYSSDGRHTEYNLED